MERNKENNFNEIFRHLKGDDRAYLSNTRNAIDWTE